MAFTTKAVQWLQEVKSAIGAIFAGEITWYNRNGYYGIASKLGSQGNYTGRTINEITAMKIAVVFGAVKIISEDAGSLPLFLYKRSKDGKAREKATSHPLYRVLHDAPNEEMSAIDLRSSLTAHAAVTGAGYARIARRSSTGEVIGLYPWLPTEVRTDRDSKSKLVYIRKEGNAQEKTYAMRDVFHLKGFSWNGINGFSLAQQAGNVLDLGMSAEEYAGRFFANDATPGVVLKYPNKLGPEEVKNAKAAWMKAQGGMSHSHEPAVAHSGMEVQPISLSPENTQLIAMRTFFIQEVCRVFRMPPHKLAELSHATFSNVENQEISYYTNALRPWLDRWEQAITRCCLGVDETDYYAEHEVAALLRGDFLSQTVAFSRMLEKGVYSVNEVRSMLNMNPVEGGDAHLVQLNMQSISDAEAGLNLDQNAQLAPPMKGLWRIETASLVQ